MQFILCKCFVILLIGFVYVIFQTEVETMLQQKTEKMTSLKSQLEKMDTIKSKLASLIQQFRGQVITLLCFCYKYIVFF